MTTGEKEALVLVNCLNTFVHYCSSNREFFLTPTENIENSHLTLVYSDWYHLITLDNIISFTLFPIYSAH